MSDNLVPQTFVAYAEDQLARQALDILSKRDFHTYLLMEGVRPPALTTLLFASNGRFASKFLATKWTQFERRGIERPTLAYGVIRTVAIKKPQDHVLYAGQKLENFTAALEHYAGYTKPPVEETKPKVNRLQQKRELRQHERAALVRESLNL